MVHIQKKIKKKKKGLADYKLKNSTISIKV